MVDAASNHYDPPARGAGASSVSVPTPTFGGDQTSGRNVALVSALRRTPSLDREVILDLLREFRGWCDVRNQFA